MNNELQNPIKERKYTFRLLAEAITYRTPMPVTKIIRYNERCAYPLCPRCSIGIEREYMAFCDRCGQKLNWDLFEYAKVVRPDHRRE